MSTEAGTPVRYANAGSNPDANGLAKYATKKSQASPRGESAALQIQSSGVFVYRAASQTLEPIESDFNTDTAKRTVLLLNDLFAKAYYGGKVWEAELSALPQDGTGFIKYIDPDGRVVWFPLCWVFSRCPPAFFLAAPQSESQLGVEVSYVNVYTSLAEMDNSALCAAYFRIYRRASLGTDVTQTAQLVAFTDSRVTVTPATLTADTEGFDASLSSSATTAYERDTCGLAYRVPDEVEVITLPDGTEIGRDASLWVNAADDSKPGHLPPVFV